MGSGKGGKEDGDEELGDPEPCEDAVLASSTFRSRVRIRFHVSGARDGVEEPHLDEVIFDMKRQLTQFETSPLLNKGVYTSRIVPASFRCHLIGGSGTVGWNSHSSLGRYGFHAGVQPKDAHKMAEIANDIVIDETQNKETAEGVWALKKQVADAEAYKLQEEIKDERREMERKLRVDIDRTDGSLTADTPRSVLSLHYDNDGEPDDDDVVVSREEEEDLDPVETSLRQRKLLGDEAANQSKAYGTEQKKEGNGKQIAQTEADNPQRPSPSIEQERVKILGTS